jgi:hypothetical protein
MSDQQEKEPSRRDTGTADAAGLLPEELLWAEGGHASDVVLTALADGEHAIVPAEARLHVERCTTCMTYLGNAALLSLHADAQLRAREEHERAVARRPLPRLAIAGGIVAAIVGLLPSVLDGSEVASLRDWVTYGVPMFVKGLGTLAHRLDQPDSAAGLLVTYVAAVTLIAMGVVLTRILPKKEVSR